MFERNECYFFRLAIKKILLVCLHFYNNILTSVLACVRMWRSFLFGFVYCFFCGRMKESACFQFDFLVLNLVEFGIFCVAFYAPRSFP